MRFAVLSMVLFVAAAHAEDDQPRLAFGNDAGSELSVTWNRPVGVAGFVEFRRAGAAEWARQVSEPVAWPEMQRTVHTVWLLGLEPATTYEYRVGDGATWSAVFEFETAPDDPCVPFNFASLGDDRSQDDFGPSLNFGPILEEALATDPAFVLNGGDLVESGDSPEQWFNWLDHTGDRLSRVPHLPTIGNHDDDRVQGDDAAYNRLFTLPRNDTTDTEDFYFVEYADLLVVSLSSTTYRDDGWAAQATWLDRVLTEHPRRWKVVILHHPFYTSTLFGLEHDPNEVGQNAPIVPILDRHHVDLVIQSHNHWYQRFLPSFGGLGDDAEPVMDEADGTIYVTTGGSGAFTADVNELFGVLDIECGITPGCAILRGEHHFLAFEVEPNLITATVHATAAQNFGNDPANREVIDQFTIEKSGAERIDCDNPPPEPDAAVPEPDAAPPVDAEAPEPDLGPDAGPPDAGIEADALAVDAVVSDVPLARDASVVDARRAIRPEAGTETGADAGDSGCGCDAPGRSAAPWLALLLVLGRRRQGLSNNK